MENQPKKRDRRAYDRTYYQKNKEKRIAYQTAYNQRPKVKAYQKTYRQNHKEQTLAYWEAFRQNPEAIERKRIYQNTYYQRPEVKERQKKYSKTYGEEYRKRPEVKEYMGAYTTRYSRERYKKDQYYRTKTKIHTRLAKVLKKCGSKKDKPSKLYGIDFKAITQHLGEPPNDGQDYVIDHIKPLCSFDFSKTEQIRKAFTPENHQWLPRQENLKKVSDDMKVSIGYGRKLIKGEINGNKTT